MIQIIISAHSVFYDSKEIAKKQKLDHRENTGYTVDYCCIHKPEILDKISFERNFYQLITCTHHIKMISSPKTWNIG